jgi:hypothetical protein
MKTVFWLKDLGPEFKIERTEDWEDLEGDEKSYGEMIRVRQSRDSYRIGTSPITGLPHRIRYTPSNLYKVSETHLGLYLKDHRNRWQELAEITGEDFNGFDADEEDFIFPISKFTEISQVIDFRKKRKISEDQREEMRKRMKELNEEKSELQTQNPDKTIGSLNTEIAESSRGNLITRLNLSTPQKAIDGGDFP